MRASRTLTMRASLTLTMRISLTLTMRASLTLTMRARHGFQISLSNKIQCAQNKCIRFCLSLSNRTHIDKIEICTINWLPVDKRLSQRLPISITPPLLICQIYSLLKKSQSTQGTRSIYLIYLFVRLIWRGNPSRILVLLTYLLTYHFPHTKVPILSVLWMATYWVKCCGVNAL